MLGTKEIYKDIIENVIPLHKLLNFKLIDIKDGYAKMMVPAQEALVGDPRTQALHGGVIATIMDSVGGAAGMTTLLSTDDKISTIDIRVDYLRPGQTKDLFVEGEIVRSGNRILVTRMIAYHDNKDELVAEGKGVYNVRRKADKKLTRTTE